MHSAPVNLALDLTVLILLAILIWMPARHQTALKQLHLFWAGKTVQVCLCMVGLVFLIDFFLLIHHSALRQDLQWYSLSEAPWPRMHVLIITSLIGIALFIVLNNIFSRIGCSMEELQHTNDRLRHELNKHKQLEQFLNDRHFLETEELHYELSVQREFIDAFFDRSPASLVILDSEYRILKANQTFLNISGVNEKIILGQTLNNVLPGMAQDLNQSLQETAKTGGSTEMVETRFYLQGKNIRQMLVTCFPIPVAPKSKNPGFGLILLDIEEQRQLEERLRQSQKLEAIGRLAGGVAHDFNNLLMVIQFASDRLSKIIGSDENAHIELQDIIKAAENAGALTRQLLAFSRRQVLEPKLVDLPNALTGLQSMLARTLGNNIQVSIDAGEKATIRVDPVQLDLIILNLSINARDAMPNGGQLKISCQTKTLEHHEIDISEVMNPGLYAVLTVTDSGDGMDTETIKYIFEPFYTTKGRNEGTGLGLATVHGVIAQSGGSIRVHSVPGHGSTFEIFFPVVNLPEDAIEQNQDILTRRTKSRKILLVEDEPIVLDLMDRALTDAGYHVLTARKSKEALKLARQHYMDLDMLITDVILPGISGLDLANRILSEKTNLPVLMVSGYTADHVEIREIANLPYYFMQKPFQPIELINTVNQILCTKPAKV